MKVLKILLVFYLSGIGIIFGSEKEIPEPSWNFSNKPTGKFLLKCDVTNLLVDFDKMKSFEIDTYPLRKGTLEVFDHMILINFQETEKFFKKVIKVFRYTGTYEQQTRSKYIGKCSVSFGRKLF